MSSREYVISGFADEAGISLEAQLTALKRSGISHIEMRMVDGVNASMISEARASEIRAQLDEAGVSLSALGSPFGKIFINEDFEPHFLQFKHALKLCKILGAERIRMFSFYIPKGDVPAAWRGQVLEQIDRMLTEAEKNGIRLLHENEKGIYGDIAERCEDLLDVFAGRLGCIFDPANFIQCGERPYENFRKLGNRIEYMHIKDALMKGGSVVPSGKGDGEIARILNEMPGEGDMYLSLEPHLTVFTGLSTLQTEILKQEYSYPDGDTAFDAAASALKNILAEQGKEWK